MPRRPDPFLPFISKRAGQSAAGTTTGPDAAWSRLHDLDLIEAVLQAAAKKGKALSYAEALDQLGHAFSRPKMRALCAALGEVDRRAAERGEPPLAVLVVRASDGLPGAGWWIDSAGRYAGAREGAAAAAYIKRRQAVAFRYWRQR